MREGPRCAFEDLGPVWAAPNCLQVPGGPTSGMDPVRPPRDVGGPPGRATEGVRPPADGALPWARPASSGLDVAARSLWRCLISGSRGDEHGAAGGREGPIESADCHISRQIYGTVGRAYSVINHHSNPVSRGLTPRHQDILAPPGALRDPARLP